MSETKLTIDPIHHLNGNQFAIKEGANIKVSIDQTKLFFKKKGRKVEMTLTMTFEEDEQQIQIGEGEIYLGPCGVFTFEDPNFEINDSILNDLILTIDRTNNDAIIIETSSSDLFLKTKGVKGEHGNTI